MCHFFPFGCIENRTFFQSETLKIELFFSHSETLKTETFFHSDALTMECYAENATLRALRV